MYCNYNFKQAMSSLCFRNIVSLLDLRLLLPILTYIKVDNAAAGVYAFLWMGSKSTTSFILNVSSFTCHPNHDMGPIFYLRTDTRPTSRF